MLPIVKKSQAIRKNLTIPPSIIVVHGEAQQVILPYFEGCGDLLENYLEDYEIAQNNNQLNERYERLAAESPSDLVI